LSIRLCIPDHHNRIMACGNHIVIHLINHAAIRSRGRKIPVTWPHDGAIRDKGSGRPLAEQYQENELNMLHVSARLNDDKGGGQSTEAIVSEMLERMHTGRLKVFPSMTNWFRQKGMYHRKQQGIGSVINKVNDDVIAASHYAVMMIRYAQSDAQMNFTKQTMATGTYNPFKQFERAM